MYFSYFKLLDIHKNRVIVNDAVNSKVPRQSLDGRWKGELAPINISFQVENDEIKDLQITYRYGVSLVCEDLGTIEIKQASINTLGQIKDGNFQLIMPAQYKIHGITVENNTFEVGGVFEKDHVSGTLNFFPGNLDTKTNCLEERNKVQWEAKKVQSDQLDKLL